MKKVAIIPAIILVLALAVGVLPVQAAPTPAQGVIFEDNFSRAGNWVEESTDDFGFEYVEDAYRVYNNLEEAAVWSIRQRDLEDIVQTVDAARVDGPTDGYYGLICRFEDEDNYYLLAVGSEGYAGIARMLDGELEFLAETNSAGSVIRSGHSINQVRADCVGERLTLAANGQKLLEIEDSAFESGWSGLVVGTNPDPGVEVVFDNYAVLQPGAALPVTGEPRPSNSGSNTTPAVGRCNAARFVSDVTVKDNSAIAPRAEFTKTWRLKNVGTCTWNEDYRLVYINGKRMTSRDSFRIDERVRPGETVDVSVMLNAPNQTGRYQSNWMLRDDEGQLFGIGDRADQAFYVKIRVTSGGATGDEASGRLSSGRLYRDFCEAAWRSSAGTLACPGDEDSDDGWVVYLDEPALENGRHENEPALWTRPERSRGGWIRGVFPAYEVEAGDHFVTDIGCLADSKGCDVTFVVDAKVDNNPTISLGEWRETYDGNITRIDLDLSAYAGKDIQLILRVTNNGKPATADAFWLVPSIR